MQASKSTGTLLEQPVMLRLQGYNYFFLLSKQKESYNWAQLFEKEKKKQPLNFFFFSWNEGTMTMTTKKVDLLSKVLSFSGRQFSEWKWPSQGTFPRSDSSLWQSWKYNPHFLSDLLQWEESLSLICVCLWIFNCLSVYLFWSLKYLSILQIIEKMKCVLWDVFFLGTFSEHWVRPWLLLSVGPFADGNRY